MLTFLSVHFDSVVTLGGLLVGQGVALFRVCAKMDKNHAILETRMDNADIARNELSTRVDTFIKIVASR